MNVSLRIVSRQLGLLMGVLSGFVLAVSVFAAVSERNLSSPAFQSLALCTLVGAAMAVILYFAGRKSRGTLGQREALLLVAVSWLLGAGYGALPFRVWSGLRPDAGSVSHSFDRYINCYFEAMSGFTTTGATVVNSLATLPQSLLLWRALTHWLGGLGIVVLFVAVLPILGVGGRRVYRIEAPGPAPDGVNPRIKDTARILWLIYCGFTVAETIALRLCGMSWFDAFCHTLATLATGGFSTQDSSVAGYPSTAIHVVIIVFMVLAGVNFSLYYQLLQRKWRTVIRDPELRTYLGIIVVATVIVAVSLTRAPASGQASAMSWPTAVRDGMFQVVSVQTTTGFCSADFDAWGFVAKVTLVLLMFIGASAGSTGGGIKVVRIIMAVKILLAEIEHVYRPKVVRTIKLGRSSLDAGMKLNAVVYILGLFVLFGIGTIAIMIFEAGNDIDITTAATATVATLNNIGPGLARVGATQNYLWFSDASKVALSLLMLLGRLEVLTVLVVFSPRYWRGE